MALERLNEDLNFVGNLGDNPKRDDGLSTPQFKSIFDKAGLIIQNFINNKLIPSIESTVSEEGLLSQIYTVLNEKLDKNGGIITGSLNMNWNKISYVADPSDKNDAANKRYVDSLYTYRTITLDVNKWSNNIQVITVSGMTANTEITVAPAPTRVNVQAYAEASVLCTATGINTVTFECEEIPSVALTVNVKFRNLEVD